MLKNNSILFLYLLSFVLLGVSCKETGKEPVILLNPAYEKIEMVQSAADCLGPDGGYKTRAEDRENGDFFFSQSYTYRDSDLNVLIKSDTLGLVLDSTLHAVDTMSTEMAWIIRSHHFHMMAAHPEKFFTKIEKEASQNDKAGEWYTAIDPNGNSVRLRVYHGRGTLERMEVKNPVAPEAPIVITYEDFITTIYGPIARRVNILQGEGENFLFQFKKITINGDLIWGS